MNDDILLETVKELDLKYSISVLKCLHTYNQEETQNFKNTKVLSQTMKNVDKFLKTLDSYKEITALNRCAIGIELLNSDRKIGEMLCSEDDIENIEYIKNIIDLTLHKINIKEISERIIDTQSYLNNNENKESILINNEDDLMNTIIKFIYNNNFCFGDVLYDFFSEIELNTIFFYKNPHYKYRIDISNFTIFSVINFFNYFVFTAFRLFGRNETFLRAFLISNFFDYQFYKDYLLGELTNERSTHLRTSEHIEYLYIKNFKAGILKTKNYYYIKFGMNDNRTFQGFVNSNYKDRMNQIKKLCKELSDESICNIYYLSYYRDKDLTTNHVEKIDRIVEDISCNWKNAIVTTNDISTDEIHFVKGMLPHIRNFSTSIKDLKIVSIQLEERSKDSMLIHLLACDMTYKKEHIQLEIKKTKGSLYYFLHLNGTLKVKERLLSINDFLRIEYHIKEILYLV